MSQHVLIVSFRENRYLKFLLFVGHLNQPFLQQALYSFHVFLLLPDTVQRIMDHLLYRQIKTLMYLKCAPVLIPTSSGTGPKPAGMQSARGHPKVDWEVVLNLKTKNKKTTTKHQHIVDFFFLNRKAKQLTWSEICACRFWISAFSDMFSLCKACRWIQATLIMPRQWRSWHTVQSLGNYTEFLILS